MHQRQPQLLDVFIQHRVLQKVRVSEQLARNTVTQLPLGAQGNAVTLSERRQANGLRPRDTHGHGGQQSQRPMKSANVMSQDNQFPSSIPV